MDTGSSLGRKEVSFCPPGTSNPTQELRLKPSEHLSWSNGACQRAVLGTWFAKAFPLLFFFFFLQIGGKFFQKAWVFHNIAWSTHVPVEVQHSVLMDCNWLTCPCHRPPEWLPSCLPFAGFRWLGCTNSAAGFQSKLCTLTFWLCEFHAGTWALWTPVYLWFSVMISILHKSHAW